MNKVNKLIIILFVFGIVISACNTRVNESTTTHVRDLVQSDVFGVLPEQEQDILVYQKNEEIEGEYLELAKVEIQEVSDKGSTHKIVEKLKKEAKELGGNGILLMENSTNKEGKMTIRKIKAVVVYTLDSIPVDRQLVKL